MPEQRIFHAPQIDPIHLAQTLAAWYQSQGFEAQAFDAGQGSAVVQMRQPKDWRTYVAASVALNVTATRLGENLAVEIGAAKWAEKVVGGAAALIVFWPLAALPAWGAYKQQEIIDQTIQYIERYIALGGRVPEAPPASPWAGAPVQPSTPPRAPSTAPVAATAQVARCLSCHQPVSAEANFCPNCGARLSRTCANCGRSLNLAARFCPNCGTRVEST